MNKVRQVTIRDIARQAGVSVSTVSRAMNNKEDVSANVRERVLATAQTLRSLPTHTPAPSSPAAAAPWAW